MRLVVIMLLAIAIGAPQRAPRAPEAEPDKNDMRLPSGKSQRQEILKADHEKSKTDAAELVTLAEELQQELEKSEHQILNVRLVKKAEDIEKLARRIKDRMRRY